MPAVCVRRTIWSLGSCLLVGAVVAGQEIDFPRPSPKASVMQVVGATEVTVTYARPAVRGRQIWGGLVPFDKVWRTGANENTLIRFGTPVMVEGQPLDAGEYSVFTIPGADRWTVIFNRNTALWGEANYKEAEDALRVSVAPRDGPAVERLTFAFPEVSDTSAILELQWEKLRLALRLEVDTPNLLRQQVQAGLTRLWLPPYRAALYFLESGLNLEDALRWAEMSVRVQENYQNQAVRARLLERLGRRAEARAALERAVELGRALPQRPFNLAEMEKLVDTWK